MNKEYRDFHISEINYRSDGLIEVYAKKKDGKSSAKVLSFLLNKIELLESTFHNNVEKCYKDLNNK